MKLFDKTTMSPVVHVFSFVLVVLVLALSIAPPSSAGHGVRAFNKNAVVDGRTGADWVAAWFQWANSIPFPEHPLFDNAGCEVGQSGKVWFLGGKFCQEGDEVCAGLQGTFERECTVPAGVALYFPLLNVACLKAEAEADYCFSAGPNINEMRATLAGLMDLGDNLSVTVDGKRLHGDLKKSTRMASTVYTSVVPDENMFQAIGEPFIVPGTYSGNVADGYHAMLKPLKPGEHTLNFKAEIPAFELTFNATYHLTVVGPGGKEGGDEDGDED